MNTLHTFADDFDGPAGSPPDPYRWAHDLGRWPDNQETETYTDSTDNCFQDGNSNLVIRATKSRTWLGRTVYRSARIKTLGRFSQYLGHFEARIKVDSGRGRWPAFWLLSGAKGWPDGGEIDILESYGYGDSAVETTVHTPGPPSDPGIMYSVSQNLPGDTAFHVYRMDWEPERLTFSQDGAVYLTCDSTQIPHWCYNEGDPLYLLLNLAVDGTGGGDPSKGTFPADFTIDYVRVWQY